MFYKGSRYEHVPDRLLTTADGRQIAYKGLRKIPDARSYEQHRVVSDDRLDLLAHRYYGDPEQYWRICDVNDALHPRELTLESGRLLWIPRAEA